MKQRTDLPIILSHETRTALMIFPNRKMGGRDLLIIGLNKEVPSGQEFEVEDIEWIKAVLHFSDVQAMEITAKALTKVAKEWRKEVTE